MGEDKKEIEVPLTDLVSEEEFNKALTHLVPEYSASLQFLRITTAETLLDHEKALINAYLVVAEFSSLRKSYFSFGY